jgi:phosphoribosylformylglycinamidine cyclo-ligase
MEVEMSKTDLKPKWDYKSAGVDIEAGDALVDWLQQDEKESGPMPHAGRNISGIGGFASLFDFNFPDIKNPVLVTCTDGVGTKVKLASHFQIFHTVGQDLVGMCVNDLICTGGRPLMFLDYYATGKLHLPWAQSFLVGVKKACREAECLLAGGETAEMPGVYQSNDFDCAGFAVGVVDKEKTLGPHRVKAGDRVIGIASSGFHSNGYSLLRKVFENDLEEFRDALMMPTALYVKLVAELMNKVDLHAAAHMTGGGIENLPRVLPDNLAWNAKKWELPELFKLVQSRTTMGDHDFYRTLNCGVGFCIVLPERETSIAVEVIEKFGFKYYELGDIKNRESNSPFEGDLRGF